METARPSAPSAPGRTAGSRSSVAARSAPPCAGSRTARASAPAADTPCGPIPSTAPGRSRSWAPPPSSSCDRCWWIRSAARRPAAAAGSSRGRGAASPSNIRCSKRWANPVTPWPLVLRPDVVPDVDGDDRHAVILVHDHVEAVAETPPGERQIEQRGCRGSSHLDQRDAALVRLGRLVGGDRHLRRRSLRHVHERARPPPTRAR